VKKVTKVTGKCGDRWCFEINSQYNSYQLTKIAIALNCEDELTNLFAEQPFLSIQEVIDEPVHHFDLSNQAVDKDIAEEIKEIVAAYHLRD
jgi:hypothetical protein